MPIVSELRAVIGALQSEVEFQAAVSELGAAGIDRARISFLAQEEIAASCAAAVGCDLKQLPRVEIGSSDDRQQVRTHATSLAAGDAERSRGPALRDAVASAVASAADFELGSVVVTISEMPADKMKPAVRGPSGLGLAAEKSRP
jgi:hypothetical protein